jgi:hypothetical protein
MQTMPTAPQEPVQLGDGFRHFICTYSSERNMFKGMVHIKANTVAEAQDKFLRWVKEQSSYMHMWQLSFSLEEIKGSL